MLKVCGKHVRSLGTVAGKSQVQVSPTYRITHLISLATRAQPPFLPTFVRSFSTPSSTRSNPFPPLVEHYFYPVSTAPTITFTKGLKRRKAVIL